MSDSNALINLDLAKPATVLIEKIAEAMGGSFRPYQLKRIAKAEEIEMIGSRIFLKNASSSQIRKSLWSRLKVFGLCRGRVD
jgi:hypothetical protein